MTLLYIIADLQPFEDTHVPGKARSGFRVNPFPLTKKQANWFEKHRGGGCTGVCASSSLVKLWVGYSHDAPRPFSEVDFVGVSHTLVDTELRVCLFVQPTAFISRLTCRP